MNPEDELNEKCINGDLDIQECERLVDANFMHLEFCQPCNKEHGLMSVILCDGEFLCAKHAAIYFPFTR